MAKTFLLAGLAVAAIASIPSANAAPHDWSGGYIGVTAGGQSFGVDGSNDLGCTTACHYFASANAATLQNRPSFSPSGAGSAFGVEAGWNAPLGTGMVWGIEADISGSDASNSETNKYLYATAPTNGLFFTNTVETDWTATIRLRAGLQAGDNGLFYITGGAAFADATLKTHIAEHINSVPGCGSCGSGSSEQSDTLTGWTLGAGAELALDNNWSVKLEYLYEDFGSISSDTNFVAASSATDAFHSSADLTSNTVRVGLNFNF